ncbi:unnamed protein product [Linum trigynum]|uniref:Uncharacterized protein n=1 Tax=Linum trigynum TaxID=586398 RepID=A0AAV2FKR3_9ROSI
MSSSRVVLDSNNLFLLPYNDGTVLVVEPDQKDLNSQTITTDMVSWKQAGRVGSKPVCTHRELEVFGVVITGAKLVELSNELVRLQALINREGFTVMYFNVGAKDMYLKPGSLVRRLNDLFDWSKYGVVVPTPVGTEWDRFQQVAGGKLMVSGKGVAKLKAGVEEVEKALVVVKQMVAKLKLALQAFI